MSDEERGNQSDLEEKVFYNDGSVAVTSTRFIVGPTVYPLHGIASVSVLEIKPNRSFWWSAWPALGIAAWAKRNDMPGLMVVLILVAIGVIVAAMALRSKFSVRITTAAGQVDALVCETIEPVQAVAAALHDAIVVRG